MRAERVRADIEAPLAELGLLVEEVTVTPAGRRSVVRVAVDHDLERHGLTDPGSRVPPLSLDEVADATRVVGAALDADAGLGTQPYVLEVSSPGVDRPLTTWRHLRRNVGRLVVLTATDGRRLSGRILAVTGEALELAQDPALDDSAAASLPVDQVRSGKVVVEFGRADEFDDDDEIDADGALDADDELDPAGPDPAADGEDH